MYSMSFSESDSVRIRSSRAALVCLGLLCVLLLTAVIVLCVYIHTKSTNYTEERDQLIIQNGNLTKERDQLKSEKNKQICFGKVGKFLTCNLAMKAYQTPLLK